DRRQRFLPGETSIDRLDGSSLERQHLGGKVGRGQARSVGVLLPVEIACQQLVERRGVGRFVNAGHVSNSLFGGRNLFIISRTKRKRKEAQNLRPFVPVSRSLDVSSEGETGTNELLLRRRR